MNFNKEKMVASLVGAIAGLLVFSTVIFALKYWDEDKSPTDNKKENQEQKSDNENGVPDENGGDNNSDQDLQSVTVTDVDGKSITINYPEGWIYGGSDSDGVRGILFQKGDYLWRLEVYPVYTGAGIGYTFQTIFGDSDDINIVKEPLSIEGHKTYMRARYEKEGYLIAHQESLIQSDKLKTYVPISYDPTTDNTSYKWTGSVIHRDESTPGFGEGGLGANYSVVYSHTLFDQMVLDVDFAQFPSFEDAEHQQIMKEMNQITNSIVIVE